MNILAIETSGNVCSVAVANEEKILALGYVDNGLTHSALLMPRVDGCLREAGLGIEEMDLFAVTVGPGSFTGLRIGVSTAKSFAQALDKPIATFTTLRVLAENFAGYTGVICPVIDARNQRVYTAQYQVGEELVAPRVAALGELFGDDLPEDLLFCGDGVDAYREILRKQYPGAVLAPAHLRYQRADALISLARRAEKQGNVQTAFEVELMYLVDSQAERLLKEKNAKQATNGKANG